MCFQVSISHGEITLPDGRIMKRYINVPNARFTMEHDHTRYVYRLFYYDTKFIAFTTKLCCLQVFILPLPPSSKDLLVQLAIEQLIICYNIMNFTRADR